MDTSVEELRRGYEELKASGFPLNMVFDFGEKLGNSAQTAYHFELVLEDWERPRPQRWHPEDFFRWHRQEGVEYLRGLLTSEDRRCAVSAAYLLAELLPRGRYDDQEKITGELISALVTFAESEEPEYRRKCIIALGWVGTHNEIPTLVRHLLNDPVTLCRAWSASSFLQMWGRVPGEILRKGCCGALTACIEQETDIFVRGVAVEAVQAVWDVKLGLRSSAVDSLNQKAVNRAARRALEVLAAENHPDMQEKP